MDVEKAYFQDCCREVGIDCEKYFKVGKERIAEAAIDMIVIRIPENQRNYSQ